MATNPTLFEMPLVRDGDKNVIPVTDDGTTGLFSQQYGWQSINSLPLNAGGKAVMRQDYNGVFNLLSGVIFYAQKGFTFNYDNKQAYYKGCVVVDPTNNIKYECKADTQRNGNPSKDPTHWQVFKETYTLPTASSTTKGGVKIGSGITISSDGTISVKSYNTVTTSVAGLMSASDKVKLNGIANNANNYSLPTASSSVLGGVKIGSGITINNGVISARTYNDVTTSTHGLMTAADKIKLNGIANNANNYSLPTASGSVLGGVKIGSGVSIDGSGKISVPTVNSSSNGLMTAAMLALLGAGGVESASLSTNGYIKFKNGLIVNWGKNNLPTAQGWYDVAFAKAFTKSIFVIIATREQGTGSENEGNILLPKRVNNSKFQLFSFGGDYSNYPNVWIAIGI